MKTELTYSSAFSELEKLVTQIEDNRIPLDTLASKVKKANELIEFCEIKLRAIEKEINEATKMANARTGKKNSQ